MHILIIHQAFASLDEPGGTRHYEFARLLAARGYKVTVIASSISFITGPPSNSPQIQGILGEIKRGNTDFARPRLFRPPQILRTSVISFFSFMVSSFWIGLGVKNVDLVWALTSHLSRCNRLVIGAPQRREVFI